MQISKTGGGVEYNLSFNDIKRVEGKYERSNGDVLIVGLGGTTFVKDDKVRTGYSRTGCLLFDASTGKLRKLDCDKSPDGEKRWRKFTGTLTIAG